jgi:hypothetical protein
MELVFRIIAVILIGIAVFFWWQGNTDGLFISTVLGAVSFFLSVRFQVKDRLRQREAEREEEEEKWRKGEEEISESSSLLNEMSDEEPINNRQRTIDKGQV